MYGYFALPLNDLGKRHEGGMFPALLELKGYIYLHIILYVTDEN